VKGNFGLSRNFIGLRDVDETAFLRIYPFQIDKRLMWVVLKRHR
jgi:hypothetical protein